MSRHFRPWTIDQTQLLPAAVVDYVPADHLAQFVVALPMGRYASRKEKIDSLLHSERFVDLFSIVRNGLRASVESYSIKRLEPLL
jgi:predicted RecB family nuclease